MLKCGDVECVARRVANAADFWRELLAFAPDVILSACRYSTEWRRSRSAGMPRTRMAPSSVSTACPVTFPRSPIALAVIGKRIVVENDVARRVEAILQACFDSPYRVGDAELRVSARTGIALCPADGADAETLFRNAETALKRAKVHAERHMFYTAQMSTRVAEKLQLENKLRQALERNEFVLHYQPKVDAQTRRIAGVEALIRWNSLEMGLVPPADFIPILEETGLILEVGAWALQQAVRDQRHWLEHAGAAPRIAVNVSPVQLRKRDFVATVENAIALGGGQPGIDLEITESVLTADVETNIGKRKAVRDPGVNISIDDFGTGYSSLAYLTKLPVHTLKIDRSFIMTMLASPDVMSLVSAIISLAPALRLTVVAEGVDDEEQAKVLRLLRCDGMQGYLSSAPVPPEHLLALIGEDAHKQQRHHGLERVARLPSQHEGS